MTNRLAVLLACVTLALAGCAGGGSPIPPEQQPIVRAGLKLGLWVAAARDNGASEFERAQIRRYGEEALALVGTDGATGAELARLLEVLATTGKVEDGAWVIVADALIDWMTNPNPSELPPVT